MGLGGVGSPCALRRLTSGVKHRAIVFQNCLPAVTGKAQINQITDALLYLADELGQGGVKGWERNASFLNFFFFFNSIMLFFNATQVFPTCFQAQWSLSGLWKT